jgi:pimeloyl-ACP methyl ester carboxylesterase
MSSSKPSLVLVPGAWHVPEHFDKMNHHLHTAGYKTIGVRTPSVRHTAPWPTTFSEDVGAVRSAILSALDRDEDVVVIMHSYGGIPGSAACEGLRKADRQKAGLKSGVVAMVFIAAFAFDKDKSLVDSSPDSKLSPWCRSDTHAETGSEFTFVPDHEQARIFYGDCSAEDTRVAKSLLQKFALGSFKSEQTYPAWKYIPSTYLLCEDDMAIPVEAQEFMASQEVGDGGKWTTERFKASHSPFLSMAKETAEVIRRAAGEKV